MTELTLDEVKQKSQEISILQAEYMYKMRLLRQEYQPKIDKINKELSLFYSSLEFGDEEDGKKL